MKGSELAFRAWYGGAMFYSVFSEDEGVIFVEESDLNKLPEDQIWYPMGIVWADDKAIIMRRTNYKDSTGKWIYEDDYIETNMGIGMVSMKYDGLTIASGDPKSPHAYDSVREDEWKFFKIIGNIHQHTAEDIYGNYGKKGK